MALNTGCNYVIDTILEIGDLTLEGLLGGADLTKITLKEMVFSLMIKYVLFLNCIFINHLRIMQLKLFLFFLMKACPFPNWRRCVEVGIQISYD